MDPVYNLLSPRILVEEDKSYPAVKELKEVISKGVCRNIAVTGVFGSGKSSILGTLELYDTENKYLNISLATIDTSPEIEYSIVQQLVYKSDEKKLHQSRFRRIKHLDNKTHGRYTIRIIWLFIALIIAFEPSWLQVDGIYNLYYKVFGTAYGYWINIIFDLLSVLYVLYALYCITKQAIKVFFNSKLDKINLKEASVEISRSASVFNKHLDEILYFFKATDNNVVVFEDLDRISNPRGIFLKLREINLLLNDSEYFKQRKNESKKPITFIYAIRDEIFIGEERTKYFDYIVSAIPIVNSINSGDYLVKEYGKGAFAISDKQLIELGVYIDGMRELNNIINEFIQYKNQVGERLANDKLFAMTIYKNKYPKDYAQLHCNEGMLYGSIHAKKEFIEIATKEHLSALKDLKERKDKEVGNIVKVRESYIDYLFKHYGFNGAIIHGKSFDNREIIKSDDLFYYLRHDTIEKYYAKDEDGDSSIEEYDLKFYEIEGDVNPDMGYEESVSEFEKAKWSLSAQIEEIERKISIISGSTIATVISEIADGNEALSIIKRIYNEKNKEKALGEDPAYDVKMCEMILFLLRRGYVDEQYHSYISYFYPGTLSEADNDFLQSLMIGISKEYDYALANVNELLTRMPIEYFRQKEALNYNLLDGVIRKDDDSILNEFIGTAKGDLNFLAGYEKAGKCQQQFFEYLLSKWPDYLKIAFDINNVEHKDNLLTIFYKYCPENGAWNFKNDSYLLNDTYNVIINNIFQLNISKIKEILSSLKLSFKEMVGRDDKTIKTLYDVVVNGSYFEINSNNLELILGEGFKLKSYTTILECKNENVIKYLNNNIEEVVGLLPETSIGESKDAIIQLINHSTLSIDFKNSYIGKQTEVIDNLDGVSGEYEDILFKTNHIKPTWDNIQDNYIHSGKKLTATLKNFIETHYRILKTEPVVYRKDDDNPTGSLFVALFANNNMSLDIYGSIISQFNLQFSKNDLSDLESGRMSILIGKDKIAYNEKNISVISANFDNDIFGDFLIMKFDEFLNDEENDVEINNTVGAYILDSTLTLRHKIQLLNKFDAKIEDDDDASNFANKICFYYAEAGINADSNIDLLMVALDKANSWINKIRVINSINASLGYEKERVSSMLSTLGAEYSKLNIIRKRPRFDNNNENYNLISFLKENNHISSYDVVDNSINTVCLYP